jgi:hypothetical protein
MTTRTTERKRIRETKMRNIWKPMKIRLIITEPTISVWPGADDRKVPKAPTVLKYEDSSCTTFKWGYELDGSLEEKIEGIKLLLDLDQQRPLYAPTNIQAEIDKLGKSVLDVATDYIRAIYQHALKEIENAYIADYIKSNDKQYVLSVPAVWSEKAMMMTEQVGLVQ